MKLQFYIEKLSHSKEFREFIKKNPKAYLCSGFFIIDKKGNDNKQHLDYYIPNENKMFSFEFNEKIEMTPIDLIDERNSKKITELDFDFEDIEKMIQKEMEKQNVKNEIQKLIFSLQNIDGKSFLVCAVFISMLGLLKINVNLSENKITEFERKSFFDILRVHKS